MLPRRHVLDVLQFVKEDYEAFSMAALTLAVDAVKYIGDGKKTDHLVEALELNEFICYMYPSLRPKNRALFFHVISDLLGLLMYGVPKKSKKALENLEAVNYSEKAMEPYPVIEIWRMWKGKVYTKKHGPSSIIEGFIKKIGIEMDIIEGNPYVEDIFDGSREYIKEWLPCLSDFYRKKETLIMDTFEKWLSVWGSKKDKDEILDGMVERLLNQAEREYGLTIKKEETLSAILKHKDDNKRENINYFKYYSEGIERFLNI
ncbi:MAG: hypothetical protein N2745_04400 [Syntrophorhabdaceae bacterium]|nr:hypothetical protein [Syntrophorhabdaceae bacterium]